LKGKREEIRDYRFFSEARGTEIIYDADFTPLHDEKGSIIGAICILRDTTERHRVEHLSKLETVAQLTGGIAHDFNNLMTAAMGCLEMILRDERDRRLASIAETALRAINRGAELTQQLLAFSRRQALQPIAANLNELISEIEALVRRAVGETIEVIIEGAPNLWPCRVDAAQFEAAAMNLVLNARDAMPSGGCLTLNTRNISLGNLPDDAELPSGDYVAFAVRDTGVGMSAEVAARAFEPFYTTKEIGKGSGLGLSMVYGFAKQSGGGLRLESRIGAGSCITLYLPRARAVPITSDHAPLRAEPRCNSGTILVVEDNEDVRDVSVAMLQGFGYRVITAGNGQEALNVLRTTIDVDLLFSDLVMPGGISGGNLAQQAQLICPGLKVLLTTGYARAEMDDAVYPVLRKPFRREQLRLAIGELLNER
jgi:signal transduction histidine kinase